MKVNNLSLSSFIKLPEVKTKLREEFEKPPFSEKRTMLAPVLTSDTSRIGIAFDYLMRFYANYVNSNAVSSDWVAEKALERLNEIKDNKAVITTPNFKLITVSNIDKSPEGFIENWTKFKIEYYSQAKITIRRARKNFKTYLKTGKMSNTLIASALDLATLDLINTANYMKPLNQAEPDKDDVEDLRKLIAIINPETIKAEHTCVLSPSFGPEAEKLMSAEGDLVIDNALIDIKTFGNLKLRRETFNQIIGYYTLYRIGGIQGMSDDNKITKIGVYFSRHGYLHTYQVEDIINESTYLDFIEWFKERALEFCLP